MTTFAGWRGEYYTNSTLSGSPFVVRDDPRLNFDWGQGAPDGRLPADNFSVRWTRDVDFAAGIYRFYLRADDGVRMWIDGSLVLDQWRVASTTYQVDVSLSAGRHHLRVEYFEASGGAVVALEWYQLAGSADWRGEYYNNEALQGSPVLVRSDAWIDFDWGLGSPAWNVNADYFSVRWTGRPNLSAGTYRFQITVDDGARLWVNGVLVLDVWDRLGTHTALAAIATSGEQDVRVEYREATLEARMRLTWERLP